MPESPSREQILAQLAEIQKTKSTMSDRMAALEARLSPVVAPAPTEGSQPQPPTAAEPTLPPFEPFVPPIAPAVEPTAAAGYGAAASPDAPVAPTASGAPTSPGSGDATRIVEDAREKARAEALRREVTTIGDRIQAVFDEVDTLYDYITIKLGDDWYDKEENSGLYKAFWDIRNAVDVGEAYMRNLAGKNSTDLASIKDLLVEAETKANKAIAIPRAKKAEFEKGAPAGVGAAAPEVGTDAEGEPEQGRERKGKEKKPAIPLTEGQKAQKELETLRAAYIKAKANYDQFFGAVRFLAASIFKNKTLEAKLLEAKEKYDQKLSEYRIAYITDEIEKMQDETDSIVQSERGARENNAFLNIQDYWKKTGIVRGVASLTLLGAGTYFAVTEANVARRGLGGGAAGFGFYDIWNAGVQFWRENLGKLRELSPEKIAKMKSLEEVGKYLAAFEIDAATKRPSAGKKDSEELAAARKGIDLKDDIRYIKLLERWAELKQEQSEHTADALEDTLDEWGEDTDKKIREKARKSEKTKRKVLAGAGIIASTVVGAALGTGMLQAALGLGQEAYEKTKEGVRQVKAIEDLQKISKAAHTAVGATVEAAGKTAQSGLADSGLSTDKINAVAEQAKAAAKKAAEEAWKKSTVDVESTVKAVEEAGKQAAQEIIDTAKKEAAEAAEQAAREAAEAAKAAGEGAGETAAQASDTAFEGLPKADQMKEIHRLAMAAQTNPEISDATLQDIAKERLANKEFKFPKKMPFAEQLEKATAATKAEYLTHVTKIHAEELSTLASTIGTQGKLTLEQFENLRNLASWHDTAVGEAAHKLLVYVENPDNNVFKTSGIEQIEITKDKPLFEAFSEAEHKLGVTNAAEVDKNFANFLEHYGVDAVNAKGKVNADVLAAAKKAIKHIGETLWYSPDGVIASQEAEMMSDELEPEPEQPAAQVQDKQAPQEKPAPKAKEKIPVAREPLGPPVDQAPHASAAAKVAKIVPDAATAAADIHGLAGEGDIKGLPKGWEWIASAESIKNLPVEQIQSSPEIFYKHIIKPLIGSYPGLGTELFNQESIAKLIRDPQHGKENISQLYNAFIADEKSPIKLHLTEHEEPIVIDPRK